VIQALAEKMADSASLAGVELVLELEPDLPDTWADPEVLSQALENLIRNAFQAMAETGGRVLLKSRVAAGRVRITVQDDGPGMPQDVLERARDLYFTTKSDGSGVGLALVQQAVDMHGGHMEISSAPGQGTQVDIDLTRSRAR
jgi:signal transduction histidine kinase